MSSKALDLENIKLTVERIINDLSVFKSENDEAVVEETEKAKGHLVKGMVHILLAKKALNNRTDYDAYIKEMQKFIQS